MDAPRVILVVALAAVALTAFYGLFSLNWEVSVAAAVVVIACIVAIVRLVRAGRTTRPETN